MIAIVCVDDNNGMIFNNRRQSRDKTLNERIIEMADGQPIWMSTYSFKLFEDFNCTNINADDEFLSKAAPGEYCFVEKEDLTPYGDKIEKLILFRWNRDYPYDKTFDIALQTWKQEMTDEFPGNSHEKITMEVYTK